MAERKKMCTRGDMPRMAAVDDKNEPAEQRREEGRSKLSESTSDVTSTDTPVIDRQLAFITREEKDVGTNKACHCYLVTLSCCFFRKIMSVFFIFLLRGV